MSIGESRNPPRVPPLWLLAASTAISHVPLHPPPLLVVPGSFSNWAATVGLVACEASRFHTQPNRKVFNKVGLSCHVTWPLANTPRCGLSTADFGLPLRISTCPVPVCRLRKYA